MQFGDVSATYVDTFVLERNFANLICRLRIFCGCLSGGIASITGRCVEVKMTRNIGKLSMRIASWNIGSLTNSACDDSRYLRYRTALETLRRLSLDVLCVQETPGDAGTVFRFSRDLGLPFYVFKELSGCGGEGGTMGIGVFSRFPVELLDEYVMPNPCYQFPKGPFGAAHPERTHDKAFVCVNVSGVVVVSGHALPLHRYGIDPQVFGDSYEQLASWIVGKAEGGVPVVAAGDFNLANAAEAMPALFGAFENAVPGATRPKSGAQHDYILVSPLVEAGKADIVEARSESADCQEPLFDHRIVFAELAVMRGDLVEHGEMFAKAYQDELGRRARFDGREPIEEGACGR